MLATLIEPRVPSLMPALHLFALAAALVWASHANRFRPPPRGTWRLARAAGVAGIAGDAFLVVSAWSTGLAILAMTIAFVLGFALLLMSLLQGWPSRPLLVVAALAMAAPFVLWL